MKACGFLLAFLFAALVAPVSEARGPWLVLKNCEYLPNPSNDGDSFHVRAEGKEYIFRLYFVDAPETDAALGDRLTQQAKYFGVTVPQAKQIGEEATEFARRQMAQPFTVRSRKQDAMGRSKLERFYAFVECGGHDLGEQLVANGLARVFGMHANMAGVTVSTDAELRKLKVLEADAHMQKIGGWGLGIGRLQVRSLPIEKRPEHSFDAFFHPEKLKATGSASLTEERSPAPSALSVERRQSGKLDANTATAEQLDALPGIGAVLAGRIIAARPFKNADELRRVKGIGAKKLEKIRPFFEEAPAP